MPRSLRSRLIAAFAAIIFLTLLLAGVSFLVIFRQYQEQRELIRLGALVGPVTFQVRTLEQQGASAADIVETLARQADDLDVRIVLAGPQNVIFHDTEASLVGQRVDVGAAQRLGGLPRARLLSVEGPQGRRILIVGPGAPPGSSLPERFLGRPSGYTVALVSDPLTLGTVLREMAPRLLLAALLSLLASIGVAWLLAASIARPLARMTRAAEEIARGQYDQAIPAGGADEVGRLAGALNTMAREVARSDRTLRDFVANVSHDLRTPLTSIQGFSQAMVDGSLRERADYAEAGRIINEEAERMSRLVEDLLELSRIESGQAKLDFAPVELTAPVRRAVDRIERAAAEQGVELVYRHESAPSVRADARRLERAFDNLLGNALKHTPPGGRITLTIGQTDVGSGQWSVVRSGSQPPTAHCPLPTRAAFVSIHNTGSVIPADDLPRIFERFYRVDKSRAAGSAEGSGLGLAIAGEIVQAHGGRISATSAPEAGTSFTVMLPVLDAPPTTAVGSDLDGRLTPTVRRLRAS